MNNDQSGSTLKRPFNFRKPTQNVIHVPSTSAKEEAPQQQVRSEETLNQASRSREEEEPILWKKASDDKTDVEQPKMYFYYPKYLHPEAVALIAENLLREWENEQEWVSLHGGRVELKK